MTLAAMCDGCGRIRTDNGETDSAEDWWELFHTVDPPTADFDADPDEDEVEDYAGEILHFCSEPCLRTWVRDREHTAA